MEKSHPVKYLLLTSIFLLTFGPFNSIFASFHVQWNSLIFFSCALILLIRFYAKPLPSFAETNAWLILCVFYAILISISGIFHTAWYFLAPPHNYLNVSGVSVIGWRTPNINFILGNSSGSISGFVYESDGVTPVQGAKIWGTIQLPSGETFYPEAATQADGSYEMTGLPAGGYGVFAERADFAPECYYSEHVQAACDMVIG